MGRELQVRSSHSTEPRSGCQVRTQAEPSHASWLVTGFWTVGNLLFETSARETKLPENCRLNFKCEISSKASVKTIKKVVFLKKTDSLEHRTWVIMSQVTHSCHDAVTVMCRPQSYSSQVAQHLLLQAALGDTRRCIGHVWVHNLDNQGIPHLQHHSCSTHSPQVRGWRTLPEAPTSWSPLACLAGGSTPRYALSDPWCPIPKGNTPGVRETGG